MDICLEEGVTEEDERGVIADYRGVERAKRHSYQ
jgi:hypothetical protein